MEFQIRSGEDDNGKRVKDSGIIMQSPEEDDFFTFLDETSHSFDDDARSCNEHTARYSMLPPLQVDEAIQRRRSSLSFYYNDLPRRVSSSSHDNARAFEAPKAKIRKPKNKMSQGDDTAVRTNGSQAEDDNHSQLSAHVSPDTSLRSEKKRSRPLPAVCEDREEFRRQYGGALNRFLTCMKRSDYSRSLVIRQRRYLRQIYAQRDGKNDLFEGNQGVKYREVMDHRRMLWYRVNEERQILQRSSSMSDEDEQSRGSYSC